MSPALTPEKTQASEPTTEGLFQSLVFEWDCATGFTSDVTEITQHQAFRRIVAMGNDAVPLLLRSIKSDPSLLVLALGEITGENPVPHESRGKITKMAKAWVAWGEKNGRLE